MAPTTAVPWPIVAVPPPLGVRVQIVAPGDTALAFTAVDDGGRGAPQWLACLPVERVGERWCLRVNGAPKCDADAADVKAAMLVMPVAPSVERPPRYAGTVPLPAPARSMLVLCVYSQSPLIGRDGTEFSRMVVLKQKILFREVAGAAEDSNALRSFQDIARDASALRELIDGFAPAAAAAPVAGAGLAAAASKDSPLVPSAPLPTVPDALTDAIVNEACTQIAQCLAKTPPARLTRAVLELPAAPTPPTAREQPAPSTLTFALASCQYPAGLLDRAPPFDEAWPGPAQASWQRLACRLDQPDAGATPSFIVLTGDQVYVDATAGLFDPRIGDDRYRLPYENLFAGRHLQDVLRRLPSFTLIDDHEIDDNWEPMPGDGRFDPDAPAPQHDRRNQRFARLGVRAYRVQQRGAESAPLWHEAVIAGFDFFLANTRTDRGPRSAATLGSARIIGTCQRRVLRRWLAGHRGGGPCFVVSPSMLLPRRLDTRAHPASALRSDGWDGYPRSLHELLARICEMRLGNVVFLSGDAHLSCVATARLRRAEADPDTAVTLHSVHSSALYAPYPFANATPDDFAHDEKDFRFTANGGDGTRDYVCEVETWFPANAGDGYAVLGLSQANGAWTLDVEFDLASGRVASAPLVLRR